MAITDLVAVVSQIRCLKNGQPVSTGTGFFYEYQDNIYLVTNRHVVVKEEDDFYPDKLRLRLHTDPNDVRKNADYEVELYAEDVPVWIEHPEAGEAVDVVAIPLKRSGIEDNYFVRALGPSNHVPDDVEISIGDDVQVIGYPLGFHDEVHNLPIVRDATLASVYPIPFRNNPYVLVDSRLHRGTSGSPVLTKPTSLIQKEGGGAALMSGAVSYFVGVHSAAVDLEIRDPDQDEPLGLNVVWFAELLPQIIEGNKH